MGAGEFVADDTGVRNDGAERALAEIESRYRAVQRATNDVIWDWDLRTDQVAWSAAALEQFGYTEAELGTTRREWVALIHQEDRDRVLRSIFDAMESGAENWSEEYRFRRKDGTYGGFLDRAVILRDETGRPVRLVGSMLNITHRRALEEEVRHAQKMQAVGKLAGGMAHEVNNMMTAVLGFGDLILQKVPAESPLRADVEEIVKAGERAAKVTQQLLAFTRQQSQQPQVLDLNSLILDLRRMLERMLGADIELGLHLSEQAANVVVDRSQFEQLLVNLVHNARDALPAGGEVHLETRLMPLDERSQLARPEVPLRLGNYVQLSIRDNGIGMDSTTRRRAFEPFFTTKPVGKGTGLGLSTAYGTIKQSDGYIWLDSEAGRGTTITIQLPLAANGTEVRQPRDTPAPMSGAETILIVEDEPLVLMISKRALEGEGYLVLEARDGNEALEVMRVFGDQVRLILSDVVMPRLGGRELASELRTLAPGIPILYMSAYTGDEVIQRGQLEAGAPFIQKPFTPFVLLRRIRELLDQTPVTRIDPLS
jgi:PAS domain S-box-containing protein